MLRTDAVVPIHRPADHAAAEDAAAHLADVVGRLSAQGYDVLYRDLSPSPSDGSTRFKVLVPGLEVETVAYHRIGERNVRPAARRPPPRPVVVGDRGPTAGPPCT